MQDAPLFPRSRAFLGSTPAPGWPREPPGYEAGELLWRQATVYALDHAAVRVTGEDGKQ